jgi:acetylglutamate kinase
MRRIEPARPPHVGDCIVIKLGGAAMAAGPLDRQLALDIASVAATGVRTTVVHGGGADITSTASALGVESSFVSGQRVTDVRMLDVVTMTLAGRVNTAVVQLLRDHGANALGLSGVDGGLLQAERDAPGVDLGFVGRVVRVDRDLLALLMGRGYVPVVAPIATSAEGILNVNADLAAGAVAGAMGASLLLYLSDVPGVRVDGGILPFLTDRRAIELIETGVITGGMIPKIQSALDALARGVDSVAIVSGSEPSLLRRIMRGETVGTRLTRATSTPRASQVAA